MPTEDKVKFLYLVLTNNDLPTLDMEAISKALNVNKSAASKRWTRLKTAMKTGGNPGPSAYEFLWLAMQHSQRSKAHDWKDIAAKCNTTPGAAAKRYARMKAAWEKGDNTVTPSKSKAMATGAVKATAMPKRKRAAAVSPSTKKSTAAMNADSDHKHDLDCDDSDVPYEPPKKKQSTVKNNIISNVKKPKVEDSEHMQDENSAAMSPFLVDSYAAIRDDPVDVQCSLRQPIPIALHSSGYDQNVDIVGYHDVPNADNQTSYPSHGYQEHQSTPYLIDGYQEHPPTSCFPSGFQDHPSALNNHNGFQDLASANFDVDQAASLHTTEFQGHPTFPHVATDSQELVACTLESGQCHLYGPTNSQDHHQASDHRQIGHQGFGDGNSSDNHMISHHSTGVQGLVDSHLNDAQTFSYNPDGFGGAFDAQANPFFLVDDFFDNFIDYETYYGNVWDSTQEAEIQARVEAWMNGEEI